MKIKFLPPFKVPIIFGSSSSLKFKLSTISIGMSSTSISPHRLEISSVTISLPTSIVEDSSDDSGSSLLETIIIWEDIELADAFFGSGCLMVSVYSLTKLPFMFTFPIKTTIIIWIWLFIRTTCEFHINIQLAIIWVGLVCGIFIKVH